MILAHTWQGILKKSILSLDSMTIKDVLFTFNIDVDVDYVYESYRLAKLKYLKLIEH